MHIVTLTCLLLLGFQGCTTKKQPTTAPSTINNSTLDTPSITLEETPTVVYTQGDEIDLKTLDGKHINLSHDLGTLYFNEASYQGENVLFFLFGNKCPHCKREIPAIKRLSTNPNIKIIGIHAQADIGDSALKRYVKQVGFHFDILSFSDDIKMIRLLKKRGLWDGGVPAHIFVDKLGNMKTLTLPEIEERI